MSAISKQELSEAQILEFNTPHLQEFALNYLKFLHSSPCTSKRRVYKYFRPLSSEELPDDEILYGADREKAYDALMASFQVCRVSGEFAVLFGNRNLYWKSRTVPGLIILKEWI